MVYDELRIVWQAAKRVRSGRDAVRNIEFLEFLALEGNSYRMRQAAMRQYLDLSNRTTKVNTAQARDQSV